MYVRLATAFRVWFGRHDRPARRWGLLPHRTHLRRGYRLRGRHTLPRVPRNPDAPHGGRSPSRRT
jgi:hypothetical protein